MTNRDSFLRKALRWSVMVSFVVVAQESPVRADGGALEGTFTLLNSGDPVDKLDIVFLGDGFTSAQQSDYNNRVDQAVAAFLDAHPFHAMRSAFNVHRVNVSSPESGTDTFSTCGGEETGDDDVSRRTALDTGFCSGGTGTVNRCVLSATSSLVTDFAANAPDDDYVVVLVNTNKHGGCRTGALTYATLTSRFRNVVVHELGHAIFDLADEYNYDREDVYTGTEPGRANITIETNRDSLKWRELVLPSTPIPTQAHPDCSVETLPDRAFDEDLVGTFEGANYRRCGIYRPQYTCRMQNSNRDFCSVCRRKILRDLASWVGVDRTVQLSQLLIRNDHDPWPRGKGEIYIRYDLASAGQIVHGRWPASGESKFGNGQTKTIDVFAGQVAEPPSGEESATLAVRVRENDWPDGDDTVRRDTTATLPAAGAFDIDEREYRLTGRVQAARLRVLLDVLNVKNDHDGWAAGAGDIYIKFWVSNGSETIRGRWPSSGTRDMDSHDSRFMKVHAASIAEPAPGHDLTVRLRVMDGDSWFTGGDDEIGDNTFHFDAASGFGTIESVHVRDEDDYRITLSIVAPEPPPVD